MFLKIKRFGRILVYTLAMYLITHLFVFFYLFPVGIPLILVNSRNQYGIKKRVTNVLFRIIGQRLTVFGLENVEPGKNYVIVANYPGSYASFALMNIFPEALILVHSFLSKVPLVSFLLKSTGATFVQQKQFGKTKKELDKTIKYRENQSIIILPEGGRSPDGKIHKFKRGFIYILRNSSLDLLPITLKGFYKLKPKNRVYLDPDSELICVIHKPLHNVDLKNFNNATLLEMTMDTIEAAYQP